MFLRYPRRISKICISKTFLSKTFISKTCIIYSVYPRPIYSRPVYPRLVYPRLVTKACICMLEKSERGVARAGLDFRRHGARPLVQQAIKTFSRLRDSRPPQSIQNHTLLNTSCKKLKSCGQLFTESKYFGSTSHLVFFFNAT